MTIITATLTSTLSPAEVLRVLTDFGPKRAEAFPGVDDKHLTVHELGDNWADVTEGNKVGWERERYDWDSAAGTVSAKTTDSNLWGPGSGWEYHLTPSGTGTRVDVTVVRNPKTFVARIIAALLKPLGKRFTSASLAKALRA